MTTSPSLIDSFRGEHLFLSNFAPAVLEFRGRTFPTAEHAFMSAKTDDPIMIERIRSSESPADAKRVGRTVELIPEWDRVRFDVMSEVLAAKFASPPLSTQLAATGGAVLIEGNSWHDQVWGSCTCETHRNIDGANALGVLLMRERLRHLLFL